MEHRILLGGYQEPMETVRHTYLCTQSPQILESLLFYQQRNCFIMDSYLQNNGQLHCKELLIQN